MQYRIYINNIANRFGKQLLFKGVTHTVVAGKPVAITGFNGAGKSTLMQIISSVVLPTKGEIEYFSAGENPLTTEEFHNLLGFSSPIITPYDALSGRENIDFALKENIPFPTELIEHFKLTAHIDKDMKKYSSGMKQRLKLIIAMMNDPKFLLLDEPSTNLDEDGKLRLYEIIEEMKSGRVILIATNEPQEVALCSEVIEVVK